VRPVGLLGTAGIQGRIYLREEYLRDLMVTQILLPKQGNTVESCLILSWKKKSGEAVTKGEVLCEVETDKAVYEVVSPSDGTLLDTFVKEGDDVPVLTTIGVIGNAGDTFSEYLPGGKQKGGVEDSALAPAQPPASTRAPEAESGLPVERQGTAASGISPRARSLLTRVKVNLDEVQGSGPGGRIIERDILAAAKNVEPFTLAARDQSQPHTRIAEQGTGIGGRVTTADLKANRIVPSSLPSGGDVEIVPLKGIRKIIADRMLESLRNSAQLTLQSSADATSLLALRSQFKRSSVGEDFRAVTITDLVHFAVVKTLLAQPAMNSLLIDNRIEQHRRVHLSFAVDTPRGLVVPVIRNAQDLSLLALSAEAKRLAAASESGKIDPAELSGGTFTVTNLGGLGIESFTPVLNLPQVGILGVNTIAPKIIDRGKGIEYVPHISFSLTIDHRVIDGAVGARFLQKLAANIAEMNLILASDTGRK
jgi:pyruvate dehydrogenase E2 component (dihydrolipoamide acetyltransferase)